MTKKGKIDAPTPLFEILRYELKSEMLMQMMGKYWTVLKLLPCAELKIKLISSFHTIEYKNKVY